MVSFRLSNTLIAVALFLQGASAVPMSHLALDKRAKCGDNGESPCICNGALGIRKKALKCPAAAFAFVDKTSATDGKVKKQSGNLGLNVQCDHMVELQFIADKINAVPGICTHLQSTAGKADFTDFFDTINNPPNLVFVEASVNGAKGVLFGGKSFATGTDQKAALSVLQVLGDEKTGVASYLGLIKTDAKSAADTIKSKMETIMGAGKGFASTFSSDYTALMDMLSAKATKDAKNLKPAAIPQQGGITIVDETQATISRCKRSLWIQAHDFVVRQVTGTTNAAAATCKLPAKTPAKTTTETPANTTTKTPAKAPAKAATAKTTTKKTTTAKKVAAVKKTTTKKKGKRVARAQAQ
ncbi:hypothetical protein V5O48_000276 [Marasmius crinis-equi]|uniref:Uncharacterized protein n=1 Tax=Marasmius crinis-equi TaxID=585013 RepID=A0ABR3G1S6_9AGAR